jgi:Uracil DNA glycosylase superfamily
MIYSPRAFRDPAKVAARRQMLNEPHIAPLTRFVAGLRSKHPGVAFPDFDPLSGGVDAEILFLFEKPGPKTSASGGGSGFISVDNDDQTASSTSRFLHDIAMPRDRTLFWNTVPGWNETRKLTRKELREGVETLRDLLPKLQKLRVIILVGKHAQRHAQPIIKQTRPELQVLVSPHPSPIVQGSRRELWLTIPSIWAQARGTLSA